MMVRVNGSYRNREQRRNGVLLVSSKSFVHKHFAFINASIPSVQRLMKKLILQNQYLKFIFENSYLKIYI